jgi:GTP-binding protein
MPQHFVTSSTEGTGKEALLEFIDQVNSDVFKDLNEF